MLVSDDDSRVRAIQAHERVMQQIAEEAAKWTPAQRIVRTLDVRSPWPPGAIIIYVTDRSHSEWLVTAVDYLMMGKTEDGSYRRSYLLGVKFQPPVASDAPRLRPGCAVIKYNTGTYPKWTVTVAQHPVGDYTPYRWPAETLYVPPPPPPPEPGFENPFSHMRQPYRLPVPAMFLGRYQGSYQNYVMERTRKGTGTS